MSVTNLQRPDSDSRRWLALVVLCAGMLMIVLDQTIVNVALPSIQHDLGFGQSNLAWVINAYLIAFGGLLLLAGRLGDLVGRRRIFLIGIALFTAASALCGLAQDQVMLVVARFVQGAGGAMTSSVILGMIITMFPAPRDQAKAIGVFSFVASAGASIGLLAGGVLTQALSWHWIFFVNLPIGVATAFLATRLVERDSGIGLRQGADVPGAALITGALMLAVYTIVKTSDLGWGSAQTLVLGAVALVLAAGFIVRERTAGTPLIPLSIFRSRAVTGANLVQMLMISGMFGTFFLGAVVLQRVLGYGPLDVGLAFLPVALCIGVLSLGITPRLNMRFGAKQTLLPGLVLVTGSLALFALAPVHAGYLSNLLAPMLLLGLGAGLVFPSVMTIAMTGVPMHQSGLASGLVNTSLQVGGALGLAVLATLSSTRTHHLLVAGASPGSALTRGFHLALVVGAGLLVAAILAAATILRPAGAEPELEHELEAAGPDELIVCEAA
ncbi:MAG TPA: DHA2 family efflux MFS transporter permease subunit [Solirubrobacteraceae bacterium]|nr:DHA2 family efflux MFS transporter permease subunit [Solirubrobacteraceae bacterium]